MRDDTPNEDFYTIGDYELCVQDKKTYERNKGIESLRNKLRPSEEIDKRTEQAKKMASLSKVDVDASVRGYESINSTDKSMVRESLVDNNKMSSAEATSLVNSMESLTDEEYEKQLNEMNKMIEAGKVGESVTNVKLVPINKI
jgi:phosphopantetheine adenylyltransferase